MKKIILLLAFAVVLQACDDGDLIVTNFLFDENNKLVYCQNNNTTVAFSINTSPDESIFFKFNDSNFSPIISDLSEQRTQSYPISSSNILTYRAFSQPISASYFCNSVPPANNNITQEYEADNGGSVDFITQAILTEDSDGDGIPDNQEGRSSNQDTDGDGIPDYLDIDDDNDNVSTSIEISLIGQPLDNLNFPDTDEDGIPNYLDEDDDNDGILTRNEDLNAEAGEDVILNPTDDDTNNNGIPNYLDLADQGELILNLYKDNTILRRFKTVVTAKNFTFKNLNANESISIEELILGSFEESANVTTEINPG
ncbi:hypothetical protein [Mesonia sp. HuA40]|uniref:hypothetical protein n=1 Tax=Mesonia sp. HuA40 TaxID=2602761 RepID=UPI0011CB71BC|nr:hypothetical protein [Mesonia sp. HuA40]TXK71176.1 hypothetical protein FT993_11460 [Mesonia sp. HuA40]